MSETGGLQGLIPSQGAEWKQFRSKVKNRIAQWNNSGLWLILQRHIRYRNNQGSHWKKHHSSKVNIVMSYP